MKLSEMKISVRRNENGEPAFTYPPHWSGEHAFYQICELCCSLQNAFNTLADMYIKETALDGQLFCTCRDEDCDNYGTEECKKCLIKHIELDSKKNYCEN